MANATTRFQKRVDSMVHQIVSTNLYSRNAQRMSTFPLSGSRADLALTSISIKAESYFCLAFPTTQTVTSVIRSRSKSFLCILPIFTNFFRCFAARISESTIELPIVVSVQPPGSIQLARGPPYSPCSSHRRRSPTPIDLTCIYA